MVIQLRLQKGDKKPKPAKKGGKASEEQENADFNKWKVVKTDEEILQEVLNDKQAKWIKFPTMEAIELMEGRHYMITPDDGMIKEFYNLFGAKLSVDIRQFTKGARVKMRVAVMSVVPTLGKSSLIEVLGGVYSRSQGRTVAVFSTGNAVDNTELITNITSNDKLDNPYAIKALIENAAGEPEALLDYGVQAGDEGCLYLISLTM